MSRDAGQGRPRAPPMPSGLDGLSLATDAVKVSDFDQEMNYQ
ncbi:MAG TPA: hypothetical protein VF553_05940 [Pyrinomonadaceae bacterium]|jgi:hypothetical protein